MVSEVFYYHIYVDVGSIKKSVLVDLVLTAVAIYQLQINFPGVMKSNNKRIIKIPISFDNKHNLSFCYLT